MGYSDFVTQDRRLVLLRVLLESGSYTANEYILLTMLETQGHAVSGDQLRTDLAWLAEQGLIELREPGGVHVAQLRNRGEDVARGRVTVPGVKRPRPE